MFKKIATVASVMIMTAQAQAASVIDTATKTAITTGFGDLKDTLLDLVATGFPFIVAGSVIMASPYIVKGLIGLAAKK